MKNVLIIAALAFGLTTMYATTSFAGCGSCGGGSSDSKADASEASHDEEADHEHTVEAGCAKCTYNMDGVKGCKTAVKVHDDVYLLKGGNIDAHNDGLCKAPKTAKVVGHAHGDEFIATSAELE